MTQKPKDRKKRSSELLSSLAHIYNILSLSSEEEESPLLQKEPSIYKLLNELKRSLLYRLLRMPANTWRMLDLLRRYKVMTARHFQSFLRVGERQIYKYLRRLEAEQFILYNERVITSGPPIRFYHYGDVSRDELTAAEILERSLQYHQKQQAHAQEPDLLVYVCKQCGREVRVLTDTHLVRNCPFCHQKEVLIKRD